jgi:hypothetical protein
MNNESYLLLDARKRFNPQHLASKLKHTSAALHLNLARLLRSVKGDPGVVDQDVQSAELVFDKTTRRVFSSVSSP